MGAAIHAAELLGRALGVFIERREQGKPGDFAHLSDEELDAALTEKLKARGFSDGQIKTLFMLTSNPPANYDEEKRVQLARSLG
jgi:hypothetical protein